MLVPLALAAGLFAAAAVNAAPPKGSTGECKDGSYTSAETKRGACAGHGGVKDWYAQEKAAPAPSKAPQAAAPAAAPAKPSASAGPSAAPAKPTASTSAAPARSTASAGSSAAPGGGAGKVWVNTPTKVYHCSNDRWYGKTKEGEYMSEAEAKSKGYHADHNKACN
jgi:hypothetical protein